MTVSKSRPQDWPGY